ncbi:MAG: DUF6364 family protein [Candidatus Korobacteraceae bacterium]
MRVTFSINRRLADRARKEAKAHGKSLEQLIREYLQDLACDDPEASIEELRRLSGQGSSRGWRFRRDQLYRIG